MPMTIAMKAIETIRRVAVKSASSIGSMGGLSGRGSSSGGECMGAHVLPCAHAAGSWVERDAVSREIPHPANVGRYGESCERRPRTRSRRGDALFLGRLDA